MSNKPVYKATSKRKDRTQKNKHLVEFEAVMVGSGQRIIGKMYSPSHKVIGQQPTARGVTRTARDEAKNKDLKVTDFEINRKIQQVELSNKELQRIVRDLRQTFQVTKITVAELKSEVQKLADGKVKLELKMAHQNYLSCFGLQQHEIENSITLPLRIYITDVTAKSDIENLLFEENENVVFEAIGPDIKGSWYKEIYYKLTGEDAKKYKAYAEKAAKLKAFEKPQAEVDNLNADTISKLLKALENTPEGALQNGRVLVVKFINPETQQSQVSSQLLSIDELIYLENNKGLIQNPRLILEQIALVHNDEKPLLPDKPTH
ncbi:hypothetical protein Q4506_17280 [Colwellia sp. 4_MG-2023]|uniref:hypothetical protein n=1 Tax=unclassified Colwellia TaxID=196834 RepID=UPI0026E15034|nr:MULTISPECIES: hypothetical protein [unclassified Colwellia]MDO6508763.1 hypothetical protein [Colwellia sp. 5_MG-2023]MDO6557428.1 hypothetical protein [Colwellia sp. 4_MG-2023]